MSVPSSDFEYKSNFEKTMQLLEEIRQKVRTIPERKDIEDLSSKFTGLFSKVAALELSQQRLRDTLRRSWIEPRAEAFAERERIYSLLRDYSTEEGVLLSADRVSELYTKTMAEKDPKAMYYLGCCYEKGEGSIEIELSKKLPLEEMPLLATGKDVRRAVELYHLASEKGHSGAARNLAALYRSGEGVAQDVRKAELLEDAAL